MKRKSLLAGVVSAAITVCLLTINILLIANTVRYCRTQRQNAANYQINPDEIALQWEDYDTFRGVLETWKIDFSIPCTNDGVVTITADGISEYGIWLNPYTLGFVILPGDVISTDFVTWSTQFEDQRMIQIQRDDETCSGRMNTRDVLTLYMLYIEQEGLQKEFEAETGRMFSEDNAETVLKNIDKQLYDGGFYEPEDYKGRVFSPVQRCVIVALVSIFAAAGMALLTRFLHQSEDEAVSLEQWNQQKQANWDNLNLPQFHSLENTGQDMPVPQTQEPNLFQRLRNLFSPVRRE